MLVMKDILGKTVVDKKARNVGKVVDIEINENWKAVSLLVEQGKIMKKRFKASVNDVESISNYVLLKKPLEEVKGPINP